MVAVFRTDVKLKDIEDCFSRRMWGQPIVCPRPVCEREQRPSKLEKK